MSPLIEFDNFLFDLDGTLADPKEGIINSYMYALNKLALNEADKESISEYFGAPLHQYFTDKHGLKEGQLENAVKLYRDYFSVKGLYENILYPGIEEMLLRLHLTGKNIFLVTVKPQIYAKQILEYFNIVKYFKGIYGSDLSAYNQTKEELIKKLLEYELLESDTCVMVGDRYHDIKGAKNNSLASIALTYGYGKIEELTEHQPDFTVNSVEELSTILMNPGQTKKG